VTWTSYDRESGISVAVSPFATGRIILHRPEANSKTSHHYRRKQSAVGVRGSPRARVYTSELDLVARGSVGDVAPSLAEDALLSK